jgi:hypothetical protein
MTGAAAFSDEILRGKPDTSLDYRKRGQSFEVAENLGFYGWLSADHLSRVAQKWCLWQGATPPKGVVF